ncbi:hypothetical protein C7J88_09555 [Staphylococcus muscae]|uniref:Hypothetical phage-related protein n=1 Tax=Staphylococcus muscae TaxID=1294 RepID=A0A240BY59_9STAP|nr:hypothetical protein [Staphylococcus muscae]AVQ34395.1 hypothetical protein C7J88_09555 [Staphylococcus muscae]PNZ01017.1 hypothetical protein CD131_09690 [Staphylococcus muscae]GGA93418.1 hypothetical protein GCM10007183_17040 [Staphylococcus muscae]SNW00605.1 hypothetical phage-related protein [Staphylococcus muscae]
MTVLEFKDFLRHLFSVEYSHNTRMQLFMVQLGWAVDRLLVSERISPFDDYDEVSELIFDELDVNQRSKNERN